MLRSTRIVALSASMASNVRTELETTVLCVGMRGPEGIARHFTLLQLVYLIADAQLMIGELAFTPWDGLYDDVQNVAGELVARRPKVPTCAEDVKTEVPRPIVLFNTPAGFEDGTDTVGVRAH